jgi:hypothetical protein
MPWDEPEKPKRPSARRSVRSDNYEDIEETSLEDLLDMGVDSETVLKMHRNSTNNRTETGSGTKPSGPRVEYRRARQAEKTNGEPINDLNASFDEMDITDELDDWGEKVILDGDDDDEYIDDYEAAIRDAFGEDCEQGFGSGTREGVSGPRSPEPAGDDEPIMALPPHRAVPQPSPAPAQEPTAGRRSQTARPANQQSSKPRTQQTRQTEASPSPSPAQPDKKDDGKKPVRRRRRRYEVEEEFLNPPGERPRMINGMPVL